MKRISSDDISTVPAKVLHVDSESTSANDSPSKKILIEEGFARDLYLNPLKCIMDFEYPVMAAFRNSFGSVKIQFCFYHLCQSTWRKIQDLGRTAHYRSDGNFREFCSQINALAFLPVAEVKTGIGALRARAPFEAGERWHQADPPPLFLPETWLWNVREATLSGDDKTNNLTEGFNNRLRVLVAEHKPNVFKLISTFQSEVCRLLSAVASRAWFATQEKETKAFLRNAEKAMSAACEEPNIKQGIPFKSIKIYQKMHNPVHFSQDQTDPPHDTNDYFRRPILLPDKHRLVFLLIEEKHRLHNHAGVQTLVILLRENFWVLRSRKITRSVISKCVACQRFKSKPSSATFASLPEERVRKSVVFETTRVDLAGPLVLRDGEKVWVVIFSCAVYRSVHFELAKDISAQSFLLALRRFISRRGRVTTIYSDNGTNFVGASNELKSIDWSAIPNHADLKRICWRFNPPAAAWWWWFLETGSIKRKGGSGRPPALNAAEKCEEVSSKTVRRILSKAGLQCWSAASKPFLTEHQRLERLRFASTHVNWTVAEWSEVLFSDKSCVQSFKNSGVKAYRPLNTRFDAQYTQPMRRSGRFSVSVWSCMSPRGIAPLHRIEENLDGNGWADILEHIIMPEVLDNHFPDGDFLFQQDNKHFPLSEATVKAIEAIESDISKASLSSVEDNIPFRVETDASEHTIAATPSQAGRPVAFFSRTLNKYELNHSSKEKKAYAIGVTEILEALPYRQTL
ncbi:hypothetical protein JTE90_024716 [Oedothorax gibbosus]|uniref:Integrase catalytic domain-containing protein n=1 Tax=Oedothorax gibbosus TaxID=931172 RepID=A0AAV6U9F4_9ARAC|nr:hypothetical protein JTE90_024716 [Oedothorax gibbosus]